MLRQTWLVILSLVISPYLSAQSVENTQDYVKGYVIFRIHPTFETKVRQGDIRIDGWDDYVSKIPGAQTQRVFPNLSSPLVRKATSKLSTPNLRMVFYLSFEENTNVEDVCRYLSLHPAILYAEPWYTHQLFYQPSDSRADTTGGRDFMWHLDQIKAREAWDIERNDTTVKIGIIDSGTWSEHPDLKDNLAYNYDDPIDGIDNDFDGYIDNYAGWDFGGSTRGLGLGDNNPSVGNVHGLWVTGIVGATADNNLGIPGLCFNCEYLPIKGASDDNISIITYGYQGIIYAIEQGVDVVNCSWGGPIESNFGRDVVNYATQIRGAALIAACGNSGMDEAFYPAAFPNVISVANSSFGDTLYTNSTYNFSVDISAPGNSIASTFDKDAYWSWGGTSAAAPVVASAVALTKAHFPDLSPYEAAQRVRITSDDSYTANPGLLDKLGLGRVNMFRALADDPRPSIRILDYGFKGVANNTNLFPGDSIYVVANWINHLDSTFDLILGLEESAESNYLEFLDDTLYGGVVGRRARLNHEQAFLFKIKDNVPFDAEVNLKLTYVDSQRNYTDFEYISLTVNPTELDVEENDLHTTVTSTGNFGFRNITGPRNQLGVSYRNRTNAIFEGGFLVSSGSGKVSDRIRNGISSDNDFRILERIRLTSPVNGDFRAKTVFDDSMAANPMGVKISHESFASAEAENSNFILFRYILENQTTDPIPDIYAGLYADWDISPAFNVLGSLTTSNASSYSTDKKYAYTYDVSGVDPAYYAMGIISEHGFFTRALENVSSTSYSNGAKYDYLRTPPAPNTGSLGGPQNGIDVAQFISAGPVGLFSLQRDSLVFVLMASDSLSGLDRTMVQAKKYYDCTVLGKAPQSNFTFVPAMPKAGQPVSFTDLNTGINDWYWDFGDGNNSTASNTNHTFTTAGTYQVSLTVDNGVCSGTFNRTIEVSIPSSLEDMPNSRWKVYPNPANEKLVVEHPDFSQVGVELQWVNVYGQLVASKYQTLSGGESVIAVPEALSQGLYQLTINNREFSQTFKILVQR
ncbi:MAG: S8 family serine peptidase [Bacteroidia bacterium]|nr:S8 family serine peptidase [Bacteroidia bacterium]